MRKFRRRMLAVIVGLMLGWYCAGFVGDGMPGLTTPAHAEPAIHEQEYTAQPQADHGDQIHGGETPHHDAGTEAAGQLVPAPDQIPFFRPVVTTIVALVALALIVGIISRSVGLQDPGIAATESDQAAAHHDDHAQPHDREHASGHH